MFVRIAFQQADRSLAVDDRLMRFGSLRLSEIISAAICTLFLVADGSAAFAQFPSVPSMDLLEQSPLFRDGVKVELVDLFASVHDSKGKLVNKLRREDFVIYDNDIPQAITQFSREYYPLSVLILLDTSGSMAGTKLDNARKSLIQFLGRLNPGDEAMLITFRTRPRVVASFTQDLNRIKQDLRKTEGDGSTALYDAILMGLGQIQNAHNRRRAILLISDGINTYGRTQLSDTVETLRRRGVELFAIGMESDLPEDAWDRRVTRSVLAKLTESAGGETFLVSDSKDLPKVCHTISEQMHNQYTIGYAPPTSTGSAWHAIRIETRKPGFTVIASKAGYYPSAHKSTN